METCSIKPLLQETEDREDGKENFKEVTKGPRTQQKEAYTKENTQICFSHQKEHNTEILVFRKKEADLTG